MKIKKAMILAAGLGTRMRPHTLTIPKPLIKVGEKNLLERGINLLIEHGINEIVINVHHLAGKIKNFLSSQNYKIKIIISDETKELLDTGGGILNGTKVFKNEPFVALNPDTLWRSSYNKELQLLEELYFLKKKPCILIIDKNKSFDPSFKGDFNINNNIITRDQKNSYIFTGLQILNQNIFNFQKEKIFSMNKVWSHLIAKKDLFGIKSNQKFYHLNTNEIYQEINNLNIND